MSDSISLTEKLKNLKQALNPDSRTHFDSLVGTRARASQMLKPTGSLNYAATQALLDATGHCVSISPENAAILDLSVFRPECLTPPLAPTIDLELACRNLLRDRGVLTAVAEHVGNKPETVARYHNYTVKNLPLEVRDILGGEIRLQYYANRWDKVKSLLSVQHTTLLNLQRIECSAMQMVTGFCFSSAQSLDQYLAHRRRVFALLYPTPFTTSTAHKLYVASCVGALELGIPAFRITVDATQGRTAWLGAIIRHALDSQFHIHWADYDRWGTYGKHQQGYPGRAIVIPLKTFRRDKAFSQLVDCLRSIAWDQRSADTLGDLKSRKLKVEPIYRCSDLFPRGDWAKRPMDFIHGELKDLDTSEPLLEAIVASSRPKDSETPSRQSIGLPITPMVSPPSVAIS